MIDGKMSLELIKEVFCVLKNVNSDKLSHWGIHLIYYNNEQAERTLYNCCKINFDSQDCFIQLLHDIASTYLGGNKARLNRYRDIRIYDGSCIASSIYLIEENNPQVHIELDGLLKELGESDVEADPLELQYKAYAICGNNIELFEKERNVKLISIHSPIVTFKHKHKYIPSNGNFVEMTDKYLDLRTAMNVMIIDKDVYLLDMSGETLFNMDRAYKQNCEKIVSKILDMKFVSNPELFRKIANSGHYPRMFVSFQEAKLKYLANESQRKRIAKMFNIQITEDGSLFLTEKKNIDNLIKVLCNRAMWDEIEAHPVEVEGLKEW